MRECAIVVHALKGHHVLACAAEAISIANAVARDVGFVFNEVQLIVSPRDQPVDVVKRYQAHK